MPRPCQRARLESGLKLDINQLARRGFIRPGAARGPIGIQWTSNYTGEEIASGFIIADMSGSHQGWFRIKIGSLNQRIILVSAARHFGGRQWYFLCPDTHRRVSVLWMPPGASNFACRQLWGQQVAYSSQFQTAVDRAYRGKARINSRLCLIGGFDSNEWALPPKPKWMRWRTYDRAVEKFDRYEEYLDRSAFALVARRFKRG
jgi:hypothetical protein